MRIDELGIAEPCTMDWAAMTPEGRARFCAACGKHVQDLTTRTEPEVRRLLAEGDACVRATAIDGQIRLRPRRSARLALASGALLFGAPAFASGQAAVEEPSVIERLVAWWNGAGPIRSPEAVEIPVAHGGPAAADPSITVPAREHLIMGRIARVQPPAAQVTPVGEPAADAPGEAVPVADPR